MPQPTSKQTLYALQDAVIARLQAMNDAQWASAKLCGSTALARFCLDHRISYDLNFVIPEGFKAGALAVALKKAGIDFETQSLVDDARLANQLHGYVVHQGQRLKVSFIEDAYSALYPVLKKKLAKAMVQTECVEALYHRKLRTVSGPAREGDSFAGGRQTARDLFDLYVLSQRVMPLRPFMQSLPYAFPSAAFDNGLAHMPWFELMDELAEISCDAQWAQAKDVSFLQNALYQQIVAGIILDRDAQVRPEPWALVSKKIYWDRDVTLATWRDKVTEGHRSYLPAAIAVLTPVEFVRFYGLANFKTHWPTLRAKLPDASQAHAGVYDLAWSRAMGGGWNLKPSAQFLSLPTKRRAFMTQVACTPGKSIYEIAQLRTMQYRRAHDHATYLVEAGQIKCVEVLENGRRKKQLFPTCK